MKRANVNDERLAEQQGVGPFEATTCYTLIPLDQFWERRRMLPRGQRRNQ
jgi:hypothetical protein